MSDIESPPSRFEHAIILLLGAGLAVAAVVACALISHGVLQIVLIATGFVLAVLLVLLGAAWRRGLRWIVSRRAWRFYGWLAVGIVSAIVLFYAEEDWRGKRAWAALQREAAARGESLELSSVFPPSVPDEENFALAPGMTRLFGYAVGEAAASKMEAAPELEPFPPLPDYRSWNLQADWALQRTTDLAAWQKAFRQHPATKDTSGDGDADSVAFPVATEPQTPAADVLLALSRYDSALAVLHKAAERPKARYPLDYERGLFGLIRGQYFPVSRFGAVAQVLCLRASAELDQNNSEAALKDILVALRLAESLRQMPYQQLQFARAKMLLACLQPVWEGVNCRRWNEQHLATLQRQFGSLDLLADFRHAVRAEMLLTMNLADQLQAYLDGRRSPAADQMHSAKGDDAIPVWLFRFLYPAGWLPQDKVWIYRFYERRPDAFKALAENERHRFLSEVRRATDPCLLVFIVPRLKETFSEGVEQALFLQTACQEAATACALERYRLARGGYPASLQELIPTFLKQVPTDLLAAKDTPLAYRRDSAGNYALYSFGLNRIDDDGKPGPPLGVLRPDHPLQGRYPRLTEGDWVWRQMGTQ
jgi:hypothetical protein